jgi:murein L,D-transpeptidase YcbB/YkuD
MGRVKLQFDEYLYVHGTYRPDELGGPYSHGCVRLKNEDALELARLIAERQGVISSKEITALERNSKRTRSVRLASPIPLRIRYDLTAEVDGEVVDFKDPYGWATTESPESSPEETASPGTRR